MGRTLYASFSDLAHAERAVGALMDFGARKEDVSLLVGHTAEDVDYKPAIPGTQGYSGPILSGVVGAGSTGMYPGSVNIGQPLPRTGATSAPFDTAEFDEMEEDINPGYNDSELERAEIDGITATTAADAGAGAVKGAGIGLGVGVLAGLASLAVPGVGLLFGGGALATAIGGAVGTAAAGAVAGGVTGYLKDQGVPDHAAERYAGAVHNRGAILAMTIPSADVNEAIAHELVSKYNGSNIEII